MIAMTKRDAVDAAMSVAQDVANGKLTPNELERQAVSELRELFGTVAGPDDPLWTLHVDIARQVLGLGGVPADELAEWLTVARSRAGELLNDSAPDNPPLPVVSSASDAASGPESWLLDGAADD